MCGTEQHPDRKAENRDGARMTSQVEKEEKTCIKQIDSILQGVRTLNRRKEGV